MSMPLRSASSSSSWTVRPSISVPAERAEANRTISSAGNARSRSSSSIVRPTAPVAPTTATRVIAAPRSTARSPPSPSSNAECSARTACGTCSARITHEILIGEVEIISMLISSSAERLEDLGGDARVRAHAGADDRDLADLTVGVDPRHAQLGLRPASSAASAARRSSVADREGDVGARPSVARLVLDDHVDVAVGVGQRGEDRGRRAGPVGDADQRDPRLVGGVGDGGDERVFHGLVFSEDKGTGAVVEAGAAVDPDAVVAGVLDRAQLQHARRPTPPSRASPRSSTWGSLRASGTIRGSALKTPATSV